ncbi:MAG TPA: hypothetical protein VK810_06555 [Dongiaceae bacterium]|nr:hypothetical protein [Dongiaceae bacterium]
MALSIEPVTLTAEQIAGLNKKLADLRHSVNNNLSLIIAASEIIRLKPESAEKMWAGLAEQPQKIAETVAQFSSELEKTLCIRRP